MHSYFYFDSFLLIERKLSSNHQLLNTIVYTGIKTSDCENIMNKLTVTQLISNVMTDQYMFEKTLSYTILLRNKQ